MARRNVGEVRVGIPADREQRVARPRADYGERLVEGLAADLTKRFGRGFSRRNLFRVRAVYLAYGDILQAPSAKSIPWQRENCGHRLHNSDYWRFARRRLANLSAILFQA
ncbi:MAG: hypothetical protein HYU75_21250 [Betaproteobacteria bacterium]|nr:hypothetical protein [Betaproteobacteria bacterium]